MNPVQKFGVFGFPIEHSLSPAMHTAAFQALGMAAEYKAYSVRPEELEQAVLKAQAGGFCGLNLTLPLKSKILETNRIIPDDFSKKAGAVNTLRFQDAKIYGYNTDAAGAYAALKYAGCHPEGKKILIIGAGGASKSISLLFAERGNPVRIINRTPEKAQRLAEEISQKTENRHISGGGLDTALKDLETADIIIQTTELGMGKYENVSFLDLLMPETEPGAEEKIFKALSGGKTAFDIVYTPAETKFLKQAKTAGATTLNGMMMLVFQGALSFEIWTGKKPDINVMKKAVENAFLKKE